jgi:uncharacterized membrane protein YphA (DoxX/SURF4 family)
MATSTTLRSREELAAREEPQVVERPTSSIGFWLLRLTFGVLPIVAGVDKFFDKLANWDKLIWHRIPDALGMSVHTFSHVAGGIEIAAGLLVLFAPRIGAPLVAIWLAGITVNLLALNLDEGEYWAIMMRDAALAGAAASLAFFAWARGPRRRRVIDLR